MLFSQRQKELLHSAREYHTGARTQASKSKSKAAPNKFQFARL